MVDHTILTQDGSPTRYHPVYDEHYHSLSGAHLEARLRYVIPSRVIETARSRGQVKILDVGFGLGTNLAWAIHEIQKEAPGAAIEIITMERELLPIEVLLQHFRALPETRLLVILKGLIEHGQWHEKNLKLELVLGEAQQQITRLEGRWDAVFFDPFSPSRNPAPWKRDFLAAIWERMAEGGILTTYSSARSVRLSLLQAGWQIGLGPRVGWKSSGTIASRGIVEPPLVALDEKLARKLDRQLKRYREENNR